MNSETTDRNYYVASCSFGKDSLAMLIKIKELGLPLDEVIYCDIRFDSEPLSGEMPLMRQFIPRAEKILQDKFGVKVRRISSEKSFLEHFYTTKKKGKHIGDNAGFPFVVGSWCNSRLKTKPINKYISSLKKQGYNVIQYVGIAYDEPERYARLNHETHISPLYDLGITERQAMELCEQYGLVSPIYQTSFRGGCWFCVKQNKSQLRNLYRTYPELWEKLKMLEKDSHNTFKPNKTLADFERQFAKERKDE